MIQDAPPIDPPAEAEIAIADEQAATQPVGLPTTENADGSLAIDLKPLAPVPEVEQCFDRDPNPLDNTIVVCRRTTDQRLTSTYGPIDAPDDFGSAVPRARLKISENAEVEANAINKGVGGFNANGGEVRVKIDF